MKKEMLLVDKILRDEEKRFRNAVRIEMEQCEIEKLPSLVKKLAKWGGIGYGSMVTIWRGSNSMPANLIMPRQLGWRYLSTSRKSR